MGVSIYLRQDRLRAARTQQVRATVQETLRQLHSFQLELFFVGFKEQGLGGGEAGPPCLWTWGLR